MHDDDLTQAPRTREDELDLLACCLNGWDPLDVDITGPEFDEPRHEQAWRALTAVAETGKAPDPSSVRLALGADGTDAAAWLLEVFARPVAPINAPAFAERIRKAAQLRGLASVARGILNEAWKPGTDPDRLRDKMRSQLDQIVTPGRDTETIAEALPAIIDEIQTGTPPGLSTPWPDLDHRIHGLAPGQVTIVAARPGVGKSLLAQNLAWHWANHHALPAHFASLEMSGGELIRRLIAQTAKVNLSALQSAALTEDDWARVTATTPALMRAPIHMCTDAVQTVDSIRNSARHLQRRHGLGLIVVDYLQLVTPRDRRISREQQVSEVSRGLKVVAKDLDVPVVALSQIRRLHDGEKNRRPGLSDLRESGAIEQDADNVLILHVPDEQNNPWGAEMLVAKARHGERGVVNLFLRTNFATIQQAARPA